MKKLMALLLALMLLCGALLVSCGDGEDEPEDLQTNSTEWETSPVMPGEPDENDVLGVGADTDDSWGPIQRN